MQQALLTLFGVPDTIGRDGSIAYAQFGTLRVLLPPATATPPHGVCAVRLHARLEAGVWTATTVEVVGTRRPIAPALADGTSASAPAGAAAVVSMTRPAAAAPSGGAFAGLARRAGPARPGAAPSTSTPQGRGAPPAPAARPPFDPEDDGLPQDIPF